MQFMSWRAEACSKKPDEVRDKIVKLMGDLINTVTPVHVKPDSLTQSAIDKVVKLQGEKEYVKASGAVFNRVGVNLTPNFAGTGYNDQTALWTEHGLRLYTFTRQ